MNDDDACSKANLPNRRPDSLIALGRRDDDEVDLPIRGGTPRDRAWCELRLDAAGASSCCRDELLHGDLAQAVRPRRPRTPCDQRGSASSRGSRRENVPAIATPTGLGSASSFARSPSSVPSSWAIRRRSRRAARRPRRPVDRRPRARQSRRPDPPPGPPRGARDVDLLASFPAMRLLGDATAPDGAPPCGSSG
jgi:hypothetical protein